MQTSEPRLMSISKAAGWLGVSRESVARLISEGRLRTVPFGASGHHRIVFDSLRQFVEGGGPKQ